MVADAVAFCQHAVDEGGFIVDVMAAKEEDGMDFFIAQDVKDAGGIAGFVTKIVGEIDGFFGGVSNIEALVFLQECGALGRGIGGLQRFFVVKAPLYAAVAAEGRDVLIAVNPGSYSGQNGGGYDQAGSTRACEP